MTMTTLHDVTEQKLQDATKNEDITWICYGENEARNSFGFRPYNHGPRGEFGFESSGWSWRLDSADFLTKIDEGHSKDWKVALQQIEDAYSLAVS